MINENFGLKNLGYSSFEGTKILPRQRWYYYKEGFSSELVDLAIQQTGMQEDEWVIDPFNGSGTTTLTASLLGINSIGVEVNPFTSFLSETKLVTINSKTIDKWLNKVLKGVQKGEESNLQNFSTFSKKKSLHKWLFNLPILKAFEGGWKKSNEITNYQVRRVIQLSLITAAMDNCNAKKDGKGLKYKNDWDNLSFDKDSFLASFLEKITAVKEDLDLSIIANKAKIINKDSRSYLANKQNYPKFKLCITSPPYLNTFDYTDIYRPELFLGKFVNSQSDLYNLRLKTMRSHIQAKWNIPTQTDFGAIYAESLKHVKNNTHMLMHKSIPTMIQAYFEDMELLLKNLKANAAKGAQIWIIVANSAYADREIPVDLIIGNIGTQLGLFLSEIGVLRYIQKRKTKHSPNVTHLRESVIIFDVEKR